MSKLIIQMQCCFPKYCKEYLQKTVIIEYIIDPFKDITWYNRETLSTLHYTIVMAQVMIHFSTKQLNE